MGSRNLGMLWFGMVWKHSVFGSRFALVWYGSIRFKVHEKCGRHRIHTAHINKRGELASCCARGRCGGALLLHSCVVLQSLVVYIKFT